MGVTTAEEALPDNRLSVAIADGACAWGWAGVNGLLGVAVGLLPA